MPAPGLAKPSEWTTSASSKVLWLQELLDDFAKSFDPGATIWEHSYDSLNKPSFVQFLLEEGNKLVELLLEHCVRTDMVANRRPLVLICHGTGGLVVKRVSLTNTLFFDTGTQHLVQGLMTSQKMY